MKIAWVTDSTSSLDEEFVKNNDIFVLPLNIIFDDESYKENVDLTEKEFYEKLRTHKGSIKSSQPALGEFVELFEKLKKEYDFGIAIHASSKLTGTYQSSKSAAEMVGFKLYAIDSKTGSYPISYMIKKGIELIKTGEKVESVIQKIEEMTSRTNLFFVPANLDQLHKSGRVSGSSALLANLLKIKPILSIEDGKAVIREKIRTEKKAKSWLINKLEESLNGFNVSKVSVVHADAEEEAKELEKVLNERFPDLETEIMMFIPVVGVHAGVGTLGLSWVNE